MVETMVHHASAASLTLPPLPMQGPHARLSLAPGMARYSLRARSADRLADAIGRPVPGRIGEAIDGIACLGPDEYYALLPEATALPMGEGQPASLVDISARAVGLRLEGPGAVEVLSAGCPLDLARMAPGAVTRTVFETVEIILWRESPSCFHIDVWRSFAPWLWHALAAAMDPS